VTWHKPADCEICSVLESHPTATNAEVKSLGGGIWGERTIRRHRNTPRLDDVDSFFNVPTSIVTSRGKSTRLPDGSWEKITYRPQDGALLDALNYDDIERFLDSRPVTTPPKSCQGRTAVLGLADLQLAKTASGGGTKETVERVFAAVDRFVEFCEADPPAEIVVAECGDVIEGFDNIGTQRSTNDLDLTSQVRTARRVLLEVMQRVKDLAPKVVLVSVPSNHAMVRLPGTKDIASTPANDWGIELSHQLGDVLRYREGWEHVSLLRPDGDYAEAVTYTTVTGAKIGFVHGHQANSQAKLADWWRGQAMGRRNGLHEADILLHGHYHNFRVETIGDSRWLLGLPSPDPGSDWYTNKTGDASSPGLLAFDISGPGSVPWSNLRIL